MTYSTNLYIKIIYFSFFTCLFFSTNIFSQQIALKGFVINSITKEKIPYSNIGIQSKDVGTISDEDGNFLIYIPSTCSNDTLSVSHLGFSKERFAINKLVTNKEIVFELTPETKVLEEVKIAFTTKKKLIKIGTQSYSTMVAGYVREKKDKNKDILEFAKKIKIKKPIKLESININLFLIRLSDASFRINFYTEVNGLPAEKINTEEIIVNTIVKEGWNSIDVSKYNLQFDKPFFIALEYLPKSNSNIEPFRYSGQLFGESITRSSSFGNWKRKKGLTMSMFITALE